ncbi:MAG: recombinase family protein [Pirellula sp.]|jgi:DNA invertase Pin-like site-specific DNA recombinase|nr:recombinase family protein [Pirellula sp.]
MKSAVAYIRVSTDDQANEGVSLDAQEAKIKAWALLNDYTLDQVFVDAGLSGGRADNRPGLQAALQAACKTGAALVVYSLSRLARSTRDTIAISERLDKAGGDLISLSEKLDTSSASGKMIFRLMAVLSEFERDQISERTKMALGYKKSCGERVGTIPYGYDLDTDGVSLVPNEIEQQTIWIIQELRARGLSLRAIATELQNQGRPTKKGNPKWTHTSVKSILERVA